MAQAAVTHDLRPRSISFKGTIQTLEAFQPAIERTHHFAGRVQLYQHLLDAVAKHGVADRPNRFETRVKKRRLDHYGWLMKPRTEVKLLMAKSVM